MKLPFLLSTALLLATTGILPAAKPKAEIPLTSRGKELHAQYSKQLETLRAEVVAAIPAVDEAKKARFLDVRAKWSAIPRRNEEMSASVAKANEAQAVLLQMLQLHLPQRMKIYENVV